MRSSREGNTYGFVLYLYVALVLVGGFLLVHLHPTSRSPLSTQPLGPSYWREDKQDECLQAQPCGSTTPVTVLQLIKNGQKYDRKPIQLEATPTMVRRRNSPCGPYLAATLKDSEGYWVHATCYVPVELGKGKRWIVRGFYRAHEHSIDACLIKEVP